MNGHGALTVEVTRRREDTTLARIIQQVESAQAARAPRQQFIDRFAAWYTPAVVATAALIAAVPLVVDRRVGRHVDLSRARASGRRVPVRARDLHTRVHRLGARRRRSTRRPDQRRRAARAPGRRPRRSRSTRPERSRPARSASAASSLSTGSTSTDVIRHRRRRRDSGGASGGRGDCARGARARPCRSRRRATCAPGPASACRVSSTPTRCCAARHDSSPSEAGSRPSFPQAAAALVAAGFSPVLVVARSDAPSASSAWPIGRGPTPSALSPSCARLFDYAQGKQAESRMLTGDHDTTARAIGAQVGVDEIARRPAAARQGEGRRGAAPAIRAGRDGGRRHQRCARAGRGRRRRW